jgi:rhodanese-related sulfurtransferase
MSSPITASPLELQVLLDGHAEFALLDVREKVHSDAGHILGCTNVPRRLLEDRVALLVPLRTTPVVVADHDGTLGAEAGADLRALSYRDVRWLEGGFLGWAAAGLPVSQGHSVPSKDFGELVQEFEQVPTVTAQQLQGWIDGGRTIELCDVRTPEEHARETLPGSRNFPGFELPVRLQAVDDDTTVVVHCSGRTRSIIGAATLLHSGFRNVVALENGTMGWKLAGNELDHGAARDATTTVPRSDAIGPRWRTLARSVGATSIPPERVKRLVEAAGVDLGTVYLFDVRSEREYLDGHARGSVWAPSGQLVQLTDAYVAVHDATIVVMCDDDVRSSIAAYWLRRLGTGRVVICGGGFPAWREAGLPVEAGRPETVLGLEEARATVTTIGVAELAEQLASDAPPTVIHVGVSDGYEEGHLPGAIWVSPTWLEPRLDDVAPDRACRLVITCRSGRRALLTARKAERAGWQDVVVLEGGVASWDDAGEPVEQGPPQDVEPDDVFIHPIFLGEGAMRAYLEWEERLGHKYAVDAAVEAEQAASNEEAGR